MSSLPDLLSKERIIAPPPFNLSLFNIGGRSFCVRPLPEARLVGTAVAARSFQGADRDALASLSGPRDKPMRSDRPSSQWGLIAIAWTLVGVPLAWGILKTLTLAIQMFR